jgi:hypothetical protein
MYCVAPFTHMHLNRSGEINLCYGSNWTSRPVGSIFKTDLWDLWTSPEAAEFRDTIRDGSFRHCTDCRIPELHESGSLSQDLDLGVVDNLVLAYDRTCNLTCPCCRVGVERMDDLTLKIHEALLGSKVWSHVRTLITSGCGEPLSSLFFWGLCSYLETVSRRPDFGIRLMTNGLLVTPENVKRILGSVGRIVGIDVSVDAACEETYAINRRGGDWNVLMENLAYMASTGIPLRLNFTVQDDNFREMPEFVALASKFNAHYIRFDAINNWGTYTREEYLERAVHFPSHPQHGDLKVVLGHPALADERVHLAQLSDAFFETLSPLRTLRVFASRS